MNSHHALSRCALISASALAVFAAGARAQNPSPTPALSEVRTSATAERSLESDLAIVTVRFAAMGPTPAAAGRLVAARADSLRRAFQALGVPRDSILTGSRRGWPWDQGSRVDMVEGRLQRLPDGTLHSDTTFRVHEAMAVRVRDLSKVGAVIDSAFAYGVIDIPPIAFAATVTEDARLSAVREATQRARAKATVIAAANGGRLGRTIMLSTDGWYYERSDDLAVALTSSGYSSATSTGAGTVVLGPQVRITVTVSGRWELTDGQ